MLIPAMSHQFRDVVPAAAAEEESGGLDGASADEDGSDGEGIVVAGGMVVEAIGAEGDGSVTLGVGDGAVVIVGESVGGGTTSGVDAGVPVREGVGEGVEAGGVITVPRSA